MTSSPTSPSSTAHRDVPSCWSPPGSPSRPRSRSRSATTRASCSCPRPGYWHGPATTRRPAAAAPGPSTTSIVASGARNRPRHGRRRHLGRSTAQARRARPARAALDRQRAAAAGRRAGQRVPLARSGRTGRHVDVPDRRTRSGSRSAPRAASSSACSPRCSARTRGTSSASTTATRWSAGVELRECRRRAGLHHH